MKILESPAKLMKVGHSSKHLKSSTPKFIKEAQEIHGHLQPKDPRFIKDLMKISDKLAQVNWERNQLWNASPSKEESAPALFAYNGDVYRGLQAETLQSAELEYLEKNLRMISGLYGLLRPSDRVMLYRLEMGCGFGFKSYKNLYDFWTEKLTLELNSELKKKDFVLNLASQEYSKAINFKEIKAPVISFEFLEMIDGKLKKVMSYFKQARGLVARFCAQNNVEKPEEVKTFNLSGYLFDDQRSTKTNFVFTRG